MSDDYKNIELISKDDVLYEFQGKFNANIAFKYVTALANWWWF